MKNVVKGLGLFLVSLAGLVGSAYATVPTGVDTAIQAASADAVTVGGYVITGVAALIGIAWILSMMKKR